MPDIILPTLYQHQEDIRDRTREALAKRGRVIMTAPPGMGKTRCAKWILGASANREPSERQSGRVLFAVHRRGLVDNASNSFREDPELGHGVIMSGVEGSWGAKVHVGSIDTLLSWFIEGGEYDTSITFDLIVFDETHSHLPKLSKFLKYHDAHRKELGKHPAFVVGLTATPQCEGLADVYREIVQGPSTQWLTDNRFLAPFRYFRATQGQLGLLVKRGGEFTKDSEASAMEGMAGDLVRDWKKFAEGRPTVGFFPRRSHAQEARDDLSAAGLRVDYVDGETDDVTRQRIYWELNNGRLDYLCNVQVVERGTDIPRIGCVQLCVAIGSVVRYRQMIGRGSRVHPDKTDCVARGTLILTHRGEVPIEKVRDGDRLWDGLDFVSHGGAICKGIQNVITYQGLTATPDHFVHTEEGWRTLGDCARKQIPIIQTGLGGTAIRERGDHIPPHRTPWQGAISACESALRHLFAGVHGFLGQLAARADQGVPSLQPAQAHSKMVLFASSEPATAVQQPQHAIVRAIRWAGNSIQIPVSVGSLSVDQGEFGDSQGHAIGSHRQRRPLRTGKPPVVHTAAKPSTHPEEASVRSTGQVPATLPGSAIRRLDTEKVDRRGDDVRGDRGSVPQFGLVQTQREVWDILNAGPLHRFTAQGLLVHNCLVLDHGGNVSRHGFFEDDPPWSLDRSSKAVGEVAKKPTIECPECQAIYRGGQCRNCGYEPTKKEWKAQGLEFDGTELKEFKKPERKKVILGAEELMVKALYSAGKRSGSWRQALGIFFKMAEAQGTKYRVPKNVSVGGHRYRMLPYGSMDQSRRVRELFPFTKTRGDHSGKYHLGEE